MNDERLRRAYAELVARDTRTDRVECPPPESLLALVERHGSEDERLRILDHVMGCGLCRPELELLRAAGAAHPPEGGGSGERRPLLFRFRHTAMAAGIALALIGGAMLLMPGEPEQPVFRQGSTTPEALVEPSGSLPERPTRLLWRSVDDAVRYRVEILDEGGAPLFETSTTDTALALPAEPELGVGAYMWRVEAVLLGGMTRSMGVASFSIDTR